MPSHFGCPGVGGSLGECAVCGKPFVRELLCGETCTSLQIPGIEGTLYVHNKPCLEQMVEIKERGGTWYELPDGPIRRLVVEQHGPTPPPKPLDKPDGEHGKG